MNKKQKSIDFYVLKTIIRYGRNSPVLNLKKRRESMKLTGSQVVAEVLLDHGVDTVFGYPGGTALNIYDELYKYSDRIKHVLTAHEQGAAHAADGYARATGKTGVVFSTSGPERQIWLPALQRRLWTAFRWLPLRQTSPIL